jgi:ATP-dependent exoDNAse (exonuclease V) alpha subunit
MLKIVLEKTPIFSKIILMGDKGQLPPIDFRNERNDNDSPVFDLDLPEECKHELTERVRQSEGNPILDLSDMIREEIFGNQNINKVLKTISSPSLNNGHGFDFIPYSKLNEHIEKKNKLNTRVIAFRKKTVEYFNISIRNFVLDNPKEMFIKGDIVCMLDNYYHMEAENIVTYILHNSDIFRLTKVHKRYQKFSDNHKMHKIEVYIGNIDSQKDKQLIVPTKEGQKEVDKILLELAAKCREKKAKWVDFWDFKKHFCICTYGYAVTAYKSQGSTYDSVYVDINDILLTLPLTPKRKLQTIYTAITRARENVYFLKSKI